MRRGINSRLGRIGVVLAALAVVAAGIWFVATQRSNTFVAEFSSTQGIYEGDSVRVLGVDVGTISSIDNSAGVSRVEMRVDADVQVPSDANALLVAQSLVAERFIQLTPVYEGGPEMEDGAVIDVDRTAVPVEWDAVKEQLMELSEAVGPTEDDPDGALSSFVESGDELLDGNGERLNRTLSELSSTMTVLSDGREDLFSTVQNLQLFVTALSNSEEEIVNFGGRLASVSDVLADQTDELDAALTNLDVAVNDIDRFLANHGPRLTTNIDKLGEATSVIRERRDDLENMLHIAPNALANFYNIYRPYQGTLNGVLALNQMGSPVEFLCGAITGLNNPTANDDADMCAEYLGPFLNTLSSNYPYGVAAPPYTPTAEPHQIEQAQTPGTETPSGVQPPANVPAELTRVTEPGTNMTDLLVATGGN